MNRWRGSVFAVMRKGFSLALAAFAVCLFIPRVAGAASWIRLLAPRDKGYAISVALDLDGNMYVCGSAKQIGTEDVNDGVNNIVVAKYGSDARQLWAKRFGDGHRDECMDIALDGDGNVHAAIVSVDDKGPKAAIARYSSTGDALGYGEYNMGKAAMAMGIAPDGEGNVYITGYSAPEGVSGKEAFVAKYDAAGQQVWRRSAPKPAESRAEGHAVAVGDGSVYVTGWVGIAGGSGAAGNLKKAFIAKYSTAGYFGWMKLLGGKGDVEGNAVAIGPQGDLLIAGVTAGDLPGSHGFGGTDAFLAKFSKSGEAGWAEMFGTPNRDFGYGAAFDDGGGLYLGGISRAAVNGKERPDSFDLFLARYAPDGARGIAGAAEISKGPEAGLVSAAFTGRIMLNTGNRVSIYNTLFEGFIGSEKDGRWSVRRWLAGPEVIAIEKEEPEDTAKREEGGKGGHLTSFKAEKKTFLMRDVDEVGHVHNFFGKSVIFVGSALALAGLLLLL